MEDQGKLNFRQTLSALLRSNRRHVRYIQALACLALIVAVAVPLSMRQSGVAMSTTETRLSCHYAGSGAHTHNADCYDADGNLVCPLEEKAFHTHTDECYATERVLVCGQEETAGHTHSASCYDAEGNLTCSLTEEPAHKHTDACYEERITDELVCGLEETAEEHVHGPACFETVTVQVADAEGADEDSPVNTTATVEGTLEEDPTPAQEFTGTLKQKDENGNEYVTLVAQVKAPQGALPKGSTMRVEAVDLQARDAQDTPDGPTVQDKLDEALRTEAGDTAAFTQTDAVDITFYDAQGNRIDPTNKVEVRITTSMIREFSDQRTANDEAVANNSLLVLHVVDKQHTTRTDAPDAEVMRDVYLINQDEHDTTTGHENTIVFEADEFSAYVVARVDNAHVAPEAEPVVADPAELAEAEAKAADEAAAEADAADDKAEATDDADPAEAKEAPKATDPTHPAQTFTHRFANNSGKELLRVDVAAPEGAFPAGTTMKVAWVDTVEVEDAVGEAVAERTDGKLLGLCAVDITFYDPEGNEIEPAKKITVTFGSDFIDTEDDSYVVHIDDEGKGEVVDALGAKELEKREIADQADELVFESDAFSTYVVAVTALHKELTASDGKTYDISVDAPAEAGIPQDAELRVSEIVEGDEGYEEYLKQTVAALESNPDDNKLQQARFFDIKIMQGEEEIHPQAPVKVSVDLADASKYADVATFDAVHFADETKGDKPDVLDASQEAGVVSFETDGFSVFGVVYTVDFHWEVDGKAYDYSIEGGDTQSLRELLVALKVVEATEADTFMAQVSDVTFSDPELVAVAKVEEDTTAGELKKELKLQPEYSDELTEDDIAAMDAKELTAPDWALMTLKAFDTEETLTIVMANGDVFTIKVTDARDPLGLDGRTFAIVNQRDGSGAWYSLQASVDENKGTRGYYLNGLAVTHTNKAVGNATTEYVNPEATAWTFEYNAEKDAYYVSCGGQYLYIDPNLTDKNNSADHSLNLVTDKDSADNGTLIKITRDESGNYFFRGYNDDSLYLWDYNNAKFWLDKQNDMANGAMRLCLPEASGNNDPHKATLISAADVQDGQKVVIYQRVLQSSDDTFTYYAIAGDGSLVEVSPSSDAIYWRGDKAIEWTVKTSGSYVTLYNEQTGNYLTPNGDGKLVHTLAEYEDDTNKTSVTLPGRDRGAYTSKISCWDYTARNTYGPNVQATTTQQGVVTDVGLQSVLFEDSQTFYFAARDPIVHDQLTTVDTVDSVSKGITIKMYDWGNATGSDAVHDSQGWDTYSQSAGHNPAIQTRLAWMQEIMGSGSDSYTARTLHQGIVSNTLDPETGFPDSNYGDHNNLSQLFADNYLTSSNANHLFLQSVYDETGYFKYSSFENYAYIGNGNDFTVYEQIGTPSTRATSNPAQGDYSSINNPADYYKVFMRGNFMPYNQINSSMAYRFNEYDPNLNALDPADPRYNERLYFIENADTSWSPNPEASANYFFGMTVEATFTQNPGGLSDHGDPMVFEFNGDDDMWVFIDGVLVLDVGGVHDAFRGTIDYRTGAVKVYLAGHGTIDGQWSNTTIKDMFRVAGKFPDGTNWDDSKVDDYFTGNTFKDYSIHDFKMIYMERGASASNLEMMFNLPTLPETAFRVGKEMPETQSGKVIQDEYADAYFYYEAWHEVDDPSAEGGKKWVRYTQGDFAGEHTAYYNGEQDANGNKVPVVWKTDSPNETKFEVKPGQIAVFPVADGAYGTNWKVCEVEPEEQSSMLDNFEIHNSSEDSGKGTTPDGKSWTSYPWSTEATIRQRNQVIYTNKPDDALVNELRITKRLNGDMILDDYGNPIVATDGSAYFEYKVFMETTDGKLLPYAPGEDRESGAYYQIDSTGAYIYYDNGVRKQAAANGSGYTYTYDDGTTETVAEPKITGYASANGSIGDIRDGDTIVIKGLLEGTEFLVYERIDRSIMSRTDQSDGYHYVFEGATIESGTAYNRVTGEDMPKHPVGTLFDEPDESGVWYTVREGEEGAGYEELHRAQGAILQNNNAQVTVKNRTYSTGTITVEKRWLDENGDDLVDHPGNITYTVYQYQHVHSWGAWEIVRPATEEENGLRKRTCTHCYKEETEAIPLLEHTHKLVHHEEVAATCTTDGYIEYWSCTDTDQGTVCGLLFSNAAGTNQITQEGTVIPAHHNWGEWAVTTPATCEGDGVETRTCSACSQTETRSIPAHGHAWGEWIDNGNGKETRTCSYDPTHQETRDAYELYPNTTDLKLSDFTWPTADATLEPGGIFKYGNNYYVIVKKQYANTSQLSSGPGGEIHTWTVTRLISGTIYTPTSFNAGNGYQGYDLRSDLNEGDLFRAENGKYYVFKNSGPTWGKNPTVDSSNWYPIPDEYCLGLGSANTLSASPRTFTMAAPRLRAAAPTANETSSPLQALLSSLDLTALNVADADGNKLVVYANASTLSTEDGGSNMREGAGNIWYVDIPVELNGSNGEDDYEYSYFVIENDVDATNPIEGFDTTYTDQGGGLTDGGVVTITNKKQPQTTDIIVLKADADTISGQTITYLAGATFYLNKGNDRQIPTVISLADNTEVAVDSDGKFTIPTASGIKITGLASGTYTLHETGAPDGYIITGGGDWTFTVSVANGEGSITDASDNVASGLTLTIPNPPGAELPEAGGPGTILYTLCGIAMIAAAGYIGFVSRRKARKEDA